MYYKKRQLNATAMKIARSRISLYLCLPVLCAVHTACMPILTEYNLCDKMDAWGKETPYQKDSKSWKTPFYELKGVYYIETAYNYREKSLPIRIVHGKCSTAWPKEKSRDLYTEVYYCTLTPQQVKDYLGEDAAELPDGTPLILHERDFDRASARRCYLSKEADRRIGLPFNNRQRLNWPIWTEEYAPTKRSFFNYVRMPVTYTVGPALNTILWLGEGVCTTGVALVYVPYLLLTSDKD